jgi:hypothetical protein
MSKYWDWKAMKGVKILNWEGQKKIEMGIRPKLGKKD